MWVAILVSSGVTSNFVTEILKYKEVDIGKKCEQAFVGRDATTWKI